jgi:hypothetical protein
MVVTRRETARRTLAALLRDGETLWAQIEVAAKASPDLGLFAIEPKTLAVLEVTQCVKHTPEVPRLHANHGGDPFAGGDLRDLDCAGLPTRAPPIPTEAEAESDEVDPDLDPEDA